MGKPRSVITQVWRRKKLEANKALCTTCLTQEAEVGKTCNACKGKKRGKRELTLDEAISICRLLRKTRIDERPEALLQAINAWVHNTPRQVTDSVIKSGD